MLLFDHPESPLAQPRNLVAGNTLAALISVSGVLRWRSWGCCWRPNPALC